MNDHQKCKPRCKGLAYAGFISIRTAHYINILYSVPLYAYKMPTRGDLMSTEQLVAGGFGGVLWTIAYIMIIWRSYKDKTYGVPFVAICTNISWEFVFTFI